MKKLLFFLLMFCFINVAFSQCPQPTNLNIIDYTTNSLTLTWTPGDSTQSSWELQYSLSDSTFSNYTSLFTISPIFGLTGLTQNVTYYFRVRAICGNYMSGYSNYVFIPTVACEPPYNEIISNITSTSAVLNFSSSNPAFNSWELGYREDDNNTSYTFITIDTNYFEFENLQPNKRYIYYLRTRCGDELSTISSTYYFTTAPLNLNVLNNNKTFYTCGEYIFDDGGDIGDHGNNYSYSVTLCPTNNANHTKRMSLRFNEFSLGSGDNMNLYSGDNYINVEGISTFTNTFLNGKTVYSDINDTSGCIRIIFNTNPTASSTGFVAYASCVDRCQIPLADLDTFYAKIDKNTYYNTYSFKYITDSSQSIPTQYRVIDYCEGDKVILYPKPQFPENGNSYYQNPSNCIYYWSFGDATYDTTRYQNNQTTHQWTDVGIYNINLMVVDTNRNRLNGHGCHSSNPINTIVRVSKNPIKSFDFLPNMCSGQPFTLNAGYDENNILVLDTVGIKYSPLFKDEDVLLIPEIGYPASRLELPLNVSGHSPSSLIGSSADIISCCVNIEHSFLGDLNIILQCPNGQQALLKSYNNGYSGFYLGIPYGGNNHNGYDDRNYANNTSVPGAGWTYCFSDVKALASSPILNNCNRVSASDASVLASNCTTCDSTNKNTASTYYKPEQNFNSLIGCPKNGEWKIIVEDSWIQDNGFVFSWELELNPTGNEGYLYQVKMDSVIWDSPFTTAINSTTSIFNPPFNSVGNFECNVRIMDQYGCVYDTNTVLNVLQSPSKPTNLNLNIETNSIRLTWQGDAISYEIYRDDALVAEVYQPVYIDPNLDITSNYCYKVVAKGTVCNSDFSDTKCSLIGLEDEITNQFVANLYPNPTKNQTILEVHGLEKNSEVSVCDLQGRVLRKYNLRVGEEKLEINVEQLVKGIYYIRIANEDSSITKKLIVE